MRAFFSLILWGILVPFGSGGLLIVLSPPAERTVSKNCLYGMLLTWVLFDLTAVPVMLTGNVYITFDILCRIVPWILGGAAVAGYAVLLIKKPLARFDRALLPKETEVRFYWLLFFILVLIQLYMALSRASFDGDDAYYVVESVMSDRTGTMYNYVPYTGETTVLDIRHALAVIPMWEAYLARMSGLHAAIIAHTVMPLFMIPLTYLVCGMLAKRLMHDRRDLLPVMMIVLALFQMFGRTSIYTAETFFLTRTWQGKAMMASFVVPLIMMLFATLFLRAHLQSEDAAVYGETGTVHDMESADPVAGKAEIWVMLALANLFAGMCTSMGIVLAAGLIILLTVSYCIRVRRLRPLLYGILSCVPNVAYLMLYMRLS